MENYSTFNRRALGTFGISFENEENKFEKPLKVLTAFAILAATFQSFMYLITSTQFDFLIASAFTIGFFSLQGCIKFLTVLGNMEKLKRIKETLNRFGGNLTRDQLKNNFKELERFRKATTSILMTNVCCIWIFNVLPMLTLAYFYFAKGFLVQIVPFAFWYPFNKTEHYFPVYFYEITSGHILTAVPLAIDGLLLLMVGQFVVQFKCLGENFATIINEFKASKRHETAEKINQAIDFHNQLFALSAELFSIFEIPLLVNVLTQTGTICFIAFIISVGKQIFGKTKFSF